MNAKIEKLNEHRVQPISVSVDDIVFRKETQETEETSSLLAFPNIKY